MEYIDEKILELRKEQKKIKYSSLETGVFIRDDLVKFERMELLGGNISMMLPVTFVPMPMGMVKIKYPSEQRPQLIMSSLDTSVNLTFSLLPQKIHPGQTKEAAAQVRAIIKKVNPAYLFYDLKEEDREDSKLSWFDYKGYAIDDQVYYVTFITPIKGEMLHGTFNCVFKDVSEWRPVANQMILSIWDQTKQTRQTIE